MQKQTIGVLGGMGPQATCDFFQKLLLATPARTDQEHLHIIIDNNPSIPDRASYILGKGEDPRPLLTAGAKRLEQAGCSFLVIPCNTAHYYLDAIEQAVSIPALHMIDIVAQTAKEMLPEGAKVGVLATSGTLASRLYHKALEKQGLELLEPRDQERVMDIIFGPQGVKAGFTQGEVRDKARQAGLALVEQGANAIVAGCTEIPLVLFQNDVPVPLLDATDLLAKAAVQRAIHRS